MRKYTLLAAVSLSALMATATPKDTKPQGSPRNMDKFITELMSRMTIEEKIGQLNLPVTGEITTGQAKSSDVAKSIEQGLVGGLFNLKGVDRIRDVQKLVELPKLRDLTLHGNPIEDRGRGKYRNFIIAQLPNLRSLDFTPLTQRDKGIAGSFCKNGSLMKTVFTDEERGRARREGK